MKITPAQKRSIGARDGGGSYGSNVGVNESGQDKPDSWGGVCGMGVPGADSAVDEKTLRDTISSSAEVRRALSNVDYICSLVQFGQYVSPLFVLSIPSPTELPCIEYHSQTY